MEEFQHIFELLDSLGARVAGVSADTWAALGVFAEQNALQFPLLSDWPNLKTIGTFGVGREGSPTAQRATFIFDAAGSLRGVVADQEAGMHPQMALAVVQEIVGPS